MGCLADPAFLFCSFALALLCQPILTTFGIWNDGADFKPLNTWIYMCAGLILKCQQK